MTLRLGLLAGLMLSFPLPLHGSVKAAALDQIVVIGDSLSDSGNAGRFSNGPVWVEQLGSRLGVPVRPSSVGGFNFAYGGARLDPRSGPTSLRAQTDLYLKQPPRPGRTLHVVFGGGNDVLAAVGTAQAERMVDDAATSLKSIVADLAEHGATDILVPSLPDVGMTPEIRSRGGRAVSQARALSDRFNAASDRVLADVGSRHRVRIHRLDIRGMAEQAREDPQAFGFLDVTTPCSGRASCEGYLFWDNVHPTTHAHARLADAAFDILVEQ